MPDATLASIPSMVGHGYYNQHSATQSNATMLAMPALERAARDVSEARPFVFADYGSSQGKNSLAPAGLVRSVTRERFGDDLPLCVYHTDLPGNDFSALFHLLETSPDTYLGSNVFGYAVGRTFYEQLFPPDTVSLGWSASTVHWLRTLPCAVPGHIWPASGPPEVHQAYAAAALSDWTAFTTARAREMRVGAHLIVVAGAGDTHDLCGAEGGINCLNDSLQEQVRTGALREEEYARMVIGGWFRPRAFYETFFKDGWRGPEGQIMDLVSADHSPLDMAGLDQYRKDGDAHAFAVETTASFRAFTEMCLLQGLDSARTDSAALMDAVYDGMRKRVEADPLGSAAHWDVVVIDIHRRA